jgi:hypothetical protein
LSARIRRGDEKNNGEQLRTGIFRPQLSLGVFSDFAFYWATLTERKLHVTRCKIDYDPPTTIARLLDTRDMIELALRTPGEFPLVSRQALESILDDVGVAARTIREMAERP